MTNSARSKLLLIDGHSMAFRGFFALPVEKFATSTGVATNAVYGFLSMLITLLKEEQPSHVAVAFDAGSHTFRTEQYPEYKGTREKTPEEFKHQIPLIEEVLHSLGITTMSKDLIEADDIIATLSFEASQAGMDVLVCSGDRDTLQLVNDRVTVLYPRRGVSDLARMTPEAVYEKYQVTPEQYPDLAAMVGETSDNLPGVPGVGPKTAAKWLGQYGDLDSLLAHADEIGGKVGQSLRDHIDQVRLNRRLGQLLRDVELPAPVAELTIKPWDRAEIDQVLDSLQFRTLRERLFALDTNPANQEATTAGAGGVELVDLERTALAEWLAAASEPLGIAIEGNQLPVDPDVWLLALGRSDGEAVVVDFAQLRTEDEAVLRAWLADEAAAKTGHGVKGLLHALSSRDIELAGVVFDSQLAAYLAHPDQRTYDLPSLAMRYLGLDLTVTDNGGQGSLDLGDESQASALGADAVVLARLEQKQREELAGIDSLELLTDLELPVTWLLAVMERDGIAVDSSYLAELSKDFAAHAENSAQAAYQSIGHTVNLGSPKQLQTVLFDELGMPKTKKIKTGYTTDAAALADLYAKTGNDFLAHLLAYRDTTKLKQTVDGLIRSTASDGRIHTTFQQTVAATGRLSSTEPNLQNIPVRTEAGRQIRRAFVVGEGYETLLTADYSQIEMRIMAHLSGDTGLIEAFNSGEDLHNFVGSRVFSVAPADVSSSMRSKIKAMSYGLAYGLSAFGLSKQLNIEVAEARGLMTDYFERFGGVRDYLHTVVEEARVTGYTETILGRRRYLPDLTSDSRQRREMAERMALNAPIQGSAADIIKIAMLQVGAALAEEKLDSRLLLQVHDELIVEVAPGELERVTALVRGRMASAATLSVPLEVSVGVGASWLAASH
ncbi:DNA polymerase I [Rarobacter faecitabidus]|uniref:DNA polymerase I n=1 Tax=Rarobacter faecitabidus TaxID=13243 RepID=A0A542ZVL7_RARFA|nr:DNA polymerase I [Rarobacter faecitabidus]TQL64408.1 DNA polymerase I [Rarobacter faecitabidus]